MFIIANQGFSVEKILYDPCIVTVQLLCLSMGRLSSEGPAEQNMYYRSRTPFFNSGVAFRCSQVEENAVSSFLKIVFPTCITYLQSVNSRQNPFDYRKQSYQGCREENMFSGGA